MLFWLRPLEIYYIFDALEILLGIIQNTWLFIFESGSLDIFTPSMQHQGINVINTFKSQDIIRTLMNETSTASSELLIPKCLSQSLCCMT